MMIGPLTCFYLCRNWDSSKGNCPKLNLENPEHFKNPSLCLSFEPFLTGDRIKRECGAVGHGCEECYIKCDLNPQTQDEEDWLAELEFMDYEYDPR